MRSLFSSIPFAVVASFSLMALGANSALAASYGNFSGSTVSFEDVNDQNGLFGSPTVSVDSLDFSPNSFEAGCPLNGCVSELVEDTLNFTIQANAGSGISSIVFNEAGDFNLSTFQTGDSAVTSVSAQVFVDIFEVDGTAINTINSNGSLVFTNNGGFNRNFDDDGVGTSSGAWTGTLTLDLDGILAANGRAGQQATRVELNINNVLTAFAGNTAIAFIEKKDLDGLSVQVIPEPGTALLMGLGLVGLASRRRGSN